MYPVLFDALAQLKEEVRAEAAAEAAEEAAEVGEEESGYDIDEALRDEL